jgi:hypothetical protein
MDSTFLLAALTIVCGAFVFFLRSLFASKCSKFQIGWGCIAVERDTDMEMQDIRNTEQITTRSRSNTPTQLTLQYLEKEIKE